MKKKKWSTVKEMLFVYLAISKIFYWFTTVMQLAPGEFSHIGPLLLERLLTRDLLIIFSILLFFFIEKFNFKPIVNNAIAYVTLLMVVFAQIWVMTHFFGAVQLEDAGISTFFVNLGYFGFFVYFTLGFFTIAIAMSVKEYLKKMKKEEAAEVRDTENDCSSELVCKTCKGELREK